MNKDIFELKIALMIISLLCLFFMVKIKDLQKEINEVKTNKYDINNDGKVDIKDLLILQKYIVEETGDKI